MRRTLFTSLFTACLTTVFAQPPAILQEGIRNDASRIPPSLPGGAMSPGSRIRIDGLRFPNKPVIVLAAAARQWTVPAIESSARHVIFQLPQDIPEGQASLTLKNDDGLSRPYLFSVTPSSAGLYSQNNLGWGPARESGHDSDERAIEATGTAAGFTLTIGGVAADARWRSLDHGLAELRFKIPANAAAGCHVPVQLRYTNGLVSNTVTIANQACEVPSPVSASAQIGLLLLARIKLLVELPGQPGIDFVDEETAFHFFSPIKSSNAPTPIEILPPPGTCLTYQGLNQQEFSPRQNLLEMLQSRVPAKVRDAGPAIALGPKTIPRAKDTHDYFAFLGGERPDFSHTATPLFLAPGTYRVKSAGGADVGQFAAEFSMPAELHAKNFGRLDSITRARGVTLEWSGGAKARPVYLLAVSVSHATTAFGAAICAAAPGSTKFTIPPDALANLPRTEPESITPMNFVFLISAPEPTQFAASGLDFGFILPFTMTGRTLEFH